MRLIFKSELKTFNVARLIWLKIQFRDKKTNENISFPSTVKFYAIVIILLGDILCRCILIGLCPLQL